MLSNGQPMEQAPHSMQLPKLTRFFFCSSFRSYPPGGQKWLQYLPVHLVAQTAWSTISMCGLPVSSLNLSVKSLSVSFSTSAGSEPFPDPAHQPDGVDVVRRVDVLVGRVDPVVGPATTDGENRRDAEVGDHRVHRSRHRHERPDDGLAVQLTHTVDRGFSDRRLGG